MARKDLGTESYDSPEFGNRWWMNRAKEPRHDLAYQRTARFGRKHCADPQLIVDYACGPALLICKLARRFPRARIVGLDESAKALATGKRILEQSGLSESCLERIELHRAVLPVEQPDQLKADLLFFSFPDFRGGLSESLVRKLRRTWAADWRATKELRRKLKLWADAEDDEEDSEDLSTAADMFYCRVATRHYAGLVRKGGIVVRVEYGDCNLDECDDVSLAEINWVEGAASQSGVRRLFQRVESRWYRDDEVVSDVYRQTRETQDQAGGYLVTVYRKL